MARAGKHKRCTILSSRNARMAALHISVMPALRCNEPAAKDGQQMTRATFTYTLRLYMCELNMTCTRILIKHLEVFLKFDLSTSTLHGNSLMQQMIARVHGQETCDSLRMRTRFHIPMHPPCSMNNDEAICQLLHHVQDSTHRTCSFAPPACIIACLSLVELLLKLPSSEALEHDFRHSIGVISLQGVHKVLRTKTLKRIA